MLLLGAVALIQCAFVPGFLSLKLARWRERSTLQLIVYAFALSLLINYCLVYGLVVLRVYHRPAVFAFIAVELAGAVWLLWNRRFVLRYRIDLSAIAEILALRRPVGWLAFGLATAAFCWYGWISYKYFGSVFNDVDDLLSWDRWAEDWFLNRFPVAAGYYPQLLPANWSLTYVILGSTDVKMFAKALMSLFPIATSLLFVDVAWREKSPRYLFSVAIYGALLSIFIGESRIVSGYMETALPFFGFLAVYALIETPDVFFAAVFAAGAALAKQGGLYFLPLCTVATLQRRSWRVIAGWLLIAPWYVHQSIAIVQGKELSNITYLANLASQGKGYLQVLVAAFGKLYNYSGFTKPFCGFLAITLLLSLRDETARKILLWALAPVLLLWALFFSYEVRTASIAFPFAAFCSAAGLFSLFRGHAIKPRNSRAVAISINWYYPIAVAVCALVVATLRTPDLLHKQIEQQKNVGYPELNRKLYAFLASEGIHGKVATDYRAFARLPELKRYYQFFPEHTPVPSLELVTEIPGVCYALIVDSEFGPRAREALEHGVYRTIFFESRRRFIQTCR